MQDVQTHYEVLEISETASQAEIKTAYRLLVQQYHPDKVPAHLSKLRHDAEERFKQIGEAYTALSDSKKRSLYDEMLREKRAEAARLSGAPPPIPSPSSEAQPTPGSTSGTGHSKKAPGNDSANSLLAWLLAGLVIAFGYWGYLLVGNRIHSNEPVFKLEKVAANPTSGKVAASPVSSQAAAAPVSSQSTAKQAAEKAESARLAQRAEKIRKARTFLVGTWRESDGGWVSYFQDGTCEIIRKGEDKSGLNWSVDGDTVTFEKPSGDQSKYSIIDISDSRYQMGALRDKHRTPTLADAFFRDDSPDERSGVKLDSSSTEIERDRLQAANIANVRNILPGGWKRDDETWRVFPDRTVHVWRNYKNGGSTADSYTWSISGNVLTLSNGRIHSGGGGEITTEYLLLGVWDDHIGLGRKGAYGVVYGGYGEMFRTKSSQELIKLSAQETTDIESAPTRLIGAWRDSDSTWTFSADGRCVIAQDDEPRQTLAWSVAGAVLTIGDVTYRIWQISDSRMVLTDLHGVFAENPTIERQRVNTPKARNTL